MSCALQQQFSEDSDERLKSDVPTSVTPGVSHSDRPAQTVSPERRQQILTRMVERDVVPQLLKRSSASPSAQGLSVERLASLCIHTDAATVVAATLSGENQARNTDRILLDLFAPAARLLGDWWADDVCSFTDVTVGVGHLQTAMHALAPLLSAGTVKGRPRRPRALLMPLPGEQHSFGLSMLADFLSRAGWRASIDSVSDLQGLHRMIGRKKVDMVGLSVSHSDMLDRTQDAIAVVRTATRNPKLIVMVGGLPFTEDPALAEAVGADGTASDGARAVITASNLLERQRKDRSR